MVSETSIFWENTSDVAPASDVYSLGLVFYQLITGQSPFHDVDAVLAGKGLAIEVDLLTARLYEGCPLRRRGHRADVRATAVRPLRNAGGSARLPGDL